MSTHSYAPAAEQELTEAHDYYAIQSDRAPNRLVAEVEAAMATVCARPTSYPPLGGELRVFRLKIFPYRIIYQFDPKTDHVTVIAVAHEKRRPDYWRERL